MGAGIGYALVAVVVLFAVVLLVLGTGPFAIVVLVVAALLGVALVASRRRGGRTEGRDRRPTAPPDFPADEIPHQEQATRERGEVFPHAKP